MSHRRREAPPRTLTWGFWGVTLLLPAAQVLDELRAREANWRHGKAVEADRASARLRLAVRPPTEPAPLPPDGGGGTPTKLKLKIGFGISLRAATSGGDEETGEDADWAEGKDDTRGKPPKRALAHLTGTASGPSSPKRASVQPEAAAGSAVVASPAGSTTSTRSPAIDKPRRPSASSGNRKKLLKKIGLL